MLRLAHLFFDLQLMFNKLRAAGSGGGSSTVHHRGRGPLSPRLDGRPPPPPRRCLSPGAHCTPHDSIRGRVGVWAVDVNEHTFGVIAHNAQMNDVPGTLMPAGE